MKKTNLKNVVLTMLALGLLASCFLVPQESLEISGEWDMGYGCTWSIDEESFTVTNPASYNWDYSGQVTFFNNDTYHPSSENPASGDFGYAVLKVTAHTGDATQIGTYKILRWNELKTEGSATTMAYSEGYKAGADWCASADIAMEQCTTANGYFTFFSTATRK